MKSCYGLPDDISIKGMFKSAKLNEKWVVQDKLEPDEPDVFIASVGCFKTKYPVFKQNGMKTDWAYLWEIVASNEIGFQVYLVEGKDGISIMGVVDAEKLESL